MMLGGAQGVHKGVCRGSAGRPQACIASCTCEGYTVQPYYLMLVMMAAGMSISALLLKETLFSHVTKENKSGCAPPTPPLRFYTKLPTLAQFHRP
eukprot:865704-Prorocentrum_minimum.AAC.1